MWNTCTGQWCGSKYEQAYREGYEQGFEDGKKQQLADSHPEEEEATSTSD